MRPLRADDTEGMLEEWPPRRRQRSPRLPLPHPESPLAADPSRSTRHGRWRAARRNMSGLRLTYVLEYGTRIERTGLTFHILRRCDIAAEDRRDDGIAKAEGAVVLVADDTIITVYRNREAYHRILKKVKYRRPLCA